jgi:hypothetical protein
MSRIIHPQNKIKFNPETSPGTPKSERPTREKKKKTSASYGPKAQLPRHPGDETPNPTCNPCRPLSSPKFPVLGSQIICFTKRETRAQGCSAAPPVWLQETRHPLSRRRRRRHSAMRCKPRVAVPSTHNALCPPPPRLQHTPQQQRLASRHEKVYVIVRISHSEVASTERRHI